MAGTPIGLDMLYYTKLLTDPIDGKATYDEPVRIPGAILANINPNPSSESLFGDDGPMETASTLGQIEVELNVTDLPYDVQAELLGHTLDEDGIMERKSNDIPPWVALGFRSLKSNGKYRYVWLVKGKFMVPEMNHETKGDGINFQTPTINGVFVKRDSDNVWIRHADEDASGFNPLIKDKWFEDPSYKPPAP